ncbi:MULTISPECIES: FadR/GntR family transcriptional regulator [unclassified Curtobacterium]|uniref:FadR/GntR family transcriptional regulator n=1 Tax=unclassified Curtobacterium TaxID=257496 RepID=UPI0037FDE20B
MTSTFDRVLDELGSAVVAGTLPEGHVDSIDGFVVRTGASRSIVREATRVLVGLGLLSAGRRVGLRVRGREHWDVIDPRVVGWRLDGPERDAVLAELRALRRAVEPEAAAAAADRVASGAFPPDGLEALVAAAGRLAADDADATHRLQSDRAVHRSLLDLSGNAVFARLALVVERALDERAHIGPDPYDMALHVALADAVARGDAPGAASAMREIVDRT